MEKIAWHAYKSQPPEKKNKTVPEKKTWQFPQLENLMFNP